MEDYVSNWSAGTPGSTPHTPLDRAPPPFLAQGIGSSTSLCTTDDEEAESQYIWTPENEQLVERVFQEYRDNPHNTPFSGRFPPSGVVQRVARAVMRRAPRGEFPHSVVAVRKRILVICAREDPELTPPPPGAQLDSFSQQPHSSNQAVGRIGGPISTIPLQVQTPNRGLGSSAADYEQFDFTESRSSAPLSSPFKEELRPRLATAMYQNNTYPSHPQQPPTDPHVLNVVAQRKRDSLKMKRGLK